MAYVIKDKDNHPITTKDGSELIGADNFEEIELKDFSDKERSFLAIASTETPDRFKDIIMVKGWQLENYRKNPVVMNSHAYQDPPLGRSLEEFTQTKKGVKRLMFRPQFAAYDEASLIYSLFRDEYLKGFSVGFLPFKEEPIKEKEKEEDKEKKSFFFHEPTRYLEQELLEVSSCSIPANPDCLIELKGMVQKGQIYIPAKYLQEEQGTEVEVYDKYIHVKFAEEDKFLDLYEVEISEGIRRVFGHQKDEDENELFDYKFIFLKDTYSKEQVVDLAEMQSKEKYEAKEFKAYDLEKYSDREPVIVELLDSLEDKDFDIEAESCTTEKMEDLIVGEDIDFKEDEYIEYEDYIKNNYEKDKEENLVEKPYPDEHACRLKDPDKYDKFARKNCWRKSDGKCIDYIFGIKAGKSDAQALRYKKDVWTASAAKSHCGKAGGTFEAAGEAAVFDYLVCTVCNYWEGYRDEENPKCPKCEAEMVASNERTQKRSDFKEITDNAYVYHYEGMLKEEDAARIMKQFKEIFGDEAKLMIIDGGNKFGKLGELSFSMDLTEKLVDEIVERVIKAIKGIMRKEKVEEVEDKVIIELEEPEEEETFDLDKDELKGMVSDSFKSVLGQLD